MHPVRVLLVDDSPEFLHAADHFLSAHAWLCVVGRALSGQEALAQIDAIDPDLVLMDLAMPGLNGLEVTRQIKLRRAPPRVLIMTLYDIAEYHSAARNVGADGFIAKSELYTRLMPTLQHMFDTIDSR